jgi:hypothetical protein
MFAQRRYRKRLDQIRMAATGQLYERIQDSNAPRHMKPELKAAAHGAGDAVHQFAVELRRTDRARHGLGEVEEFLDALAENDDRFKAAQRVVTWALLEHLYAISRPAEVLGSLIEKAEVGLGIENEQERWVAQFGPISAPASDEEGRHTRFLFGTVERVIEATLGTPVDRDKIAEAQLTWTFFFSIGIAVCDGLIAKSRQPA